MKTNASAGLLIAGAILTTIGGCAGNRTAVPENDAEKLAVAQSILQHIPGVTFKTDIAEMEKALWAQLELSCDSASAENKPTCIRELTRIRPNVESVIEAEIEKLKTMRPKLDLQLPLALVSVYSADELARLNDAVMVPDASTNPSPDLQLLVEKLDEVETVYLSRVDKLVDPIVETVLDALDPVIAIEAGYLNAGPAGPATPATPPH